MTCRLPLVLLPIALLAACGDDKGDAGDRAVAGEVQKGTISDAMLPLDTVRSQPPFAEPEIAKQVAQQAADADPAAAVEETSAPESEPAAPEAPADPISAAIQGASDN